MMTIDENRSDHREVGSDDAKVIDMPLYQRLFTLEPERYDAFVQALDNPSAPGPKLKALLKRVPAWVA